MAAADALLNSIRKFRDLDPASNKENRGPSKLPTGLRDGKEKENDDDEDEDDDEDYVAEEEEEESEDDKDDDEEEEEGGEGDKKVAAAEEEKSPSSGSKRKSASPPPQAERYPKRRRAPTSEKNRISAAELRSARGEEAREAREKEPEPTYAPHPDEAWIHNGVDQDAKRIMDADQEIQRIKSRQLHEQNLYKTSISYGFVNPRHEFCYLCDTVHTVDPSTGRNRYLETMKAYIKEYGSKPLYYIVSRLQEYYNNEILDKTRKKMTLHMWMQHILTHEPTRASIGNYQVESLMRLSMALSAKMFPEDSNGKINEKYALITLKVHEATRKAKYYAEHG